MGPRRRRSRRRARGQAGPRTRRTTSPRPSPGPPPARCRPGGRRAGEIATRREAPTTTTTTSSRDRRPSPRHQTRPRTRSSRATRRTRGLAPRTRVHTPRPSSSGALVDPTSRPASARARANNLYGRTSGVFADFRRGGRPHWIRRAKNIPETTFFKGSQFVEILRVWVHEARFASIPSARISEFRQQPIRGLRANNRPRTARSLEEEVELKRARIRLSRHTSTLYTRSS